ncbi:MAG TPA: YqgE/AlgH family protein [Thiotrichales bacterium]|nr:YqgE/AlgH family protein [Thiotrichales bacterium]
MTSSDKTENNFTGHFLIAMPSLDDGHFNQSVTYICEHDENGCFGIVINHETDIPVQQVIREMSIDSHSEKPQNSHVYLGGPVETGRGFVLHRPAGNWSSSLKINDSMALTTSKDILEAIANDEGPQDAIVALGYAGWAAGQLEQEMAQNTWLNCPADEQIIFNTPSEKRWEEAAKLIGVDLQLLSQETGHA